MPFVGADVHLARKRRWQGDADDDKLFRLYGSEQPRDSLFLNHNQDIARSRKILPLSKRTKIFTDDHHDSGEVSHIDQADPSSRRRGTSPQHTSQQQQDPANRAPRPLLTPCHVCHRKPTKKSHLDSFAECQGCGERTCFVCIRQCHGGNAAEDDLALSEQEMLSRSFQMDDEPTEPRVFQPMKQHHHRDETPAKTSAAIGWHACGHRSVVCSRCCVERGAEGDVVCLGCLSGMEGV